MLSAPVLLASVPGNWFEEDTQAALDRNVEPPELPAVVHAGIVLVTAALLASLSVLLSPAGRRAVRRSDVRVAGPLLVAGLYAAFTYRVLASAVTGANIGVGMLLLLGVLVVPAR